MEPTMIQRTPKRKQRRHANGGGMRHRHATRGAPEKSK
jgi:hypothetical protein